jgi:hypothetical protein
MAASAGPKSRWSPHWLTLVFSTVAAAAMLMVNVGRFRAAGSPDTFHGWPLTYLVRTSTSDDGDSFAPSTAEIVSFDYLHLLADVCFAAALVASTGFTVERISRRADLPKSLRLTTLLALTGFAGTCALVVPRLPWHWPDALRTTVWFIILVAIGTLWLTAFEVVQLLLRLRGRPRESDGNDT